MPFLTRAKEITITRRKPRLLRPANFLKLFGIVLLAVIIFYGYRVFTLRDFANQSKAQIYAQLEEARQALRNLDPAGAREPLGAIDEEVRLVQMEANKYGVLTLATLWGKVQEKFGALSTTLQNIAGISATAIHLNDDIAFLKENAGQLMFNRRGSELVSHLQAFKSKLHALGQYIDGVNRSSSGFDEKTLAALAGLRAEISRNGEALDAFIEVLASPAPRHLLVLFQNQSELRPAGGFIGSYAHIELQAGNINNIEIRDIYDPDGQLDQKVKPPETLQVITKDWEARDANWFFDFPTSAKKVMQFLNNSKIYQERGVVFTDVIAINTHVLRDLITLVGPIELTEYGMTITPENFLAEIQQEVEAGADKKVNQPKRILKVLAPMLLDHLTSLDETQKQTLASLLRQRLEQRDIMLYLGHPVLQRYARSQGITGDILQANPKAINEYLAVTNANLAGGKSDAFMSQNILFESVITEDGEIHNTLTVNRRHTGKGQKEWWYSATNKNFLTVYTPLGSRLTDAAGRSRWPTTPKRDYKGYSNDPDIEKIDATRRFLPDAGIDRAIINEKTAFEAWVNTAAGTSTQYVLSYKNPRILDPKSSIPYEFVFEKQSGASTTLTLSITAPPRYKWKEINYSVIEYHTDAPPGRIRIRQTLVPID